MYLFSINWLNHPLGHVFFHIGFLRGNCVDILSFLVLHNIPPSYYTAIIHSPVSGGMMGFFFFSQYYHEHFCMPHDTHFKNFSRVNNRSMYVKLYHVMESDCRWLLSTDTPTINGTYRSTHSTLGFTRFVANQVDSQIYPLQLSEDSQV